MWTDDPVRDAESYAAEWDRQSNKRKVCDHCGAILLYGDKYYLINNEELCPACVDEEYGKEVEDEY